MACLLCFRSLFYASFRGTPRSGPRVILAVGGCRAYMSMQEHAAEEDGLLPTPVVSNPTRSTGISRFRDAAGLRTSSLFGVKRGMEKAEPS